MGYKGSIFNSEKYYICKYYHKANTNIVKYVIIRDFYTNLPLEELVTYMYEAAPISEVFGVEKVNTVEICPPVMDMKHERFMKFIVNKCVNRQSSDTEIFKRCSSILVCVMNEQDFSDLMNNFYYDD